MPRSVERLVEGGCITKHIAHMRSFNERVPFIERLVEGACVSKHIDHTRHIGNVPIVDANIS